MKKLTAILFSLLFIFSCSTLNTAKKGSFSKRISRVTPQDITSHTQKILVDKYQYSLEENEKSRSTIYLETSWRDVELTEDEKERGFSNVRVRFKIRSNESRSGATNEYTVHNLLFTGNVEAYQPTSGSSSNWVRAEITPQREEYLENIYGDFKLEFDSGVMNYGEN